MENEYELQSAEIGKLSERANADLDDYKQPAV